MSQAIHFVGQLILLTAELGILGVVAIMAIVLIIGLWKLFN